MADVQDLILEKLSRIEDKLDALPCTDHAVRIGETEVTVKNLNSIRKLIIGTFIKWIIPILLTGAGAGGIIISMVKRGG